MITAKIIKHSINDFGTNIISFELEYPRFITAELNTHRMLSKNSASSRAIPLKTNREFIKEYPATPIFWGRNQPGMKARDQIADVDRAKTLWYAALDSACYYHEALENIELHKQVTNRILEPWMTMKTVITGTEWANMLYLRDHPDAQPEFRALASEIKLAIDKSTPQNLKENEWHVPYVDTVRDTPDSPLRYFSNGEEIDAETAIKISASCCAQVSYRKTDTSIEKALKIYDQLINSKPAHASPVEHQATPIPEEPYLHEGTYSWPKGVSHMTKDGLLWSGNFCDWIQYRKTIPEEAVWDN